MEILNQDGRFPPSHSICFSTRGKQIWRCYGNLKPLFTSPLKSLWKIRTCKICRRLDVETRSFVFLYVVMTNRVGEAGKCCRENRRGRERWLGNHSEPLAISSDDKAPRFDFSCTQKKQDPLKRALHSINCFRCFIRSVHYLINQFSAWRIT